MTTEGRTGHGGRDPELESRYFARMDSALDDKQRLMAFLPPLLDSGARIADVGAGSGALAERMALVTGAAVVAFDTSAEAVAQIERRARVDARVGSFVTVADTAPYDAVICSSVLHEVFSHEGADGWNRAIGLAAAALRPGGRLLIRDGVAPEHDAGPAVLTPRSHHERELLLAWRARRLGHGLDPHLILDAGAFSGPASAVAEAMLTLSWIDSREDVSFDREVSETYLAATSNGVVAALRRQGLDVIHVETYTQRGYVDALRPRMTATRAGRAWFPETKGIWVGERPGRRSVTAGSSRRLRPDTVGES